MNEFPVFEGNLTAISRQQMERVDWLMINDFRISLVQMMENAGRCLARLAVHRFIDPSANRRVVVLAGGGGNGGGALVAARRLHNWGMDVQVYLTKPYTKLGQVPLQQLRILERLGIPLHDGKDLNKSQGNDNVLIIDGIIGYSLQGAPHGLARDMIHWANDQSAPTLALDNPSGLNVTSGATAGSVIHATATLTLALPKQGLLVPDAIPHRGALYLADISVPLQLYQKIGLEDPVPRDLFADSDIIRLPDPASKMP